MSLLVDTVLGYPELVLAALSLVLVLYIPSIVGETEMWNWPILGMLPGILVRVPRFQEEIAWLLTQRPSSTFLVKGPLLARMDILLTSDPANIHHIMSRNFLNFPKGTQFSRIFEFLGDGIFNADGDSWRHQRAAARAHMAAAGFQRFVDRTTREKVAAGLVPIFDRAARDAGAVLDLQDVFQRFTFDATCKIVTGYDPGSLSPDFPEVPFSRALDDALEAVFYRHIIPESWWRLLRWLGVGFERRLTRAWKTMDGLVGQYITMKRAELATTSPAPADVTGDADLLTSYIRGGDVELDSGGRKMKIDDRFLRDTVINLMLAGRDTTSTALSWFFWLLSTNPEVAARIREELREKGGGGGEKLRLEELSYLHGALCETLRLYPPVPYEHKVASEPETLPTGDRVGPELKVVVPLYTLGRMESLWGKDCREFRPERWLSDRGGVRHEPSYKFLAFNAGPRTCLGKEVAFMQMKLAVAAIVGRYDVQLVEGHKVTHKNSIILQMKHGLMVRVSYRKDVCGANV